MAILIHTSAGGREYELGERTVIGRMDSCAIRILDGLISKQHAEIAFANGRWTLRDLGSSNGSVVNGRRVHAVDLYEGDQIVLGSAQLVFSHAAAQKKAPQVELIEESQPQVQATLQRSPVEGFRPADQIADPAQLKRDYEKLRIANELNRAIGLETDVDRLLARLLDETFKLLPADRGVILLMDPETRRLAPRAVKHARSESDEAINLSQTIINHVFQSGASVLTMDAMMDTRFAKAKSIIAGGIRSTMCVPMIYKSQLLGLIHLDSLIATNAFSEKDLQILDGVAAQAASALDNAYKAKQLERSAIARRDFERLLPPEIVEQVVSGAFRLERGGELRDTTVMFTDVRGFTAWAERQQPSHIVSVLNDYFELMVDAIHRHRGTLDKFMGDGILALFGAPISYGDDAANAVGCALEMMQFLEQFNREHEGSGDQFSIGIGIDTGPVVAGYMGSSKSMEYTAIGDHVNLASRLCGVAAPGQILVSAETMQALDGRFAAQQLPPIQVKGKAQPVRVFQVTGHVSR
ncbi:MAG TPA: adenylate/guanylate cyclase domain-containing protein [Kofleriaceae bacterium]|nr:adenylate/guanylate cyclase domain-containing protein [Kofleriaceae bacterium]